MKAFAIVINDHSVSQRGYDELVNSSKRVNNDFTIEVFNAITPDNVQDVMNDLSIQWAWPRDGFQADKKSGIIKKGYGERDPMPRHACGMSHYLLWKKCSEENEPLLIFEHDAIFNQKIDTEKLLDSHYQVIGLNDPREGTRLFEKFDSIVKSSKEDILPAPTIDNHSIAQGLAGNSAYMIKPIGARKLLDLVGEHGMWPNDAIMCKQLMPDMIGVTKTYYTRIQQGLPSTTWC